MEIILAAIAAGGLVGVSDQYLCLLIVSVAAKTGIISLAAPMTFMSSWWFLGISAVFWIISLAPAYASLLSPGVMNVINAIQKFLSGFLVPLSAALIGLSAAGVISSFNPELQTIIDSLRIFNENGSLGSTGWAITGGSAAIGLGLTGFKAATKPMVSTATGITGNLAAPVYITIENVLSLVLMVSAYLLTKVEPWLLIVLLGVIVISMAVLFIYAFRQLIKLKRGIGKVIELTETHPRAGIAVIAEFFIWGAGWMTWKNYNRGALMLILWVTWLIAFLSAQTVILALLAVVPFFIPIVAFVVGAMLLFLYAGIGFGSASALLKHVEKELAASSVPVVAN